MGFLMKVNLTEKPQTPGDGFDLALRIAGSITNLARAGHRTFATATKWKRNRRIPEKAVIDVSTSLKIPPEYLRPDLTDFAVKILREKHENKHPRARAKRNAPLATNEVASQ